MITLFGATGFTGSLIAQVLSREGLPFRLAGRSPEKLAALSASLPGKPDYVVADAANPGTFPALFKDTRLLINCAGPFTDLGERVVGHAAVSGVHYLDMTNELRYRYNVSTFHDVAVKSGAAIVPACGFEVAFADCVAARIGRSFTPGDPLDEINVVYVLGGKGTSAGTRRSAIRSLATSWIAYRDGAWVGAIPGGQVKEFFFLGQSLHALAFPSCESVTIPQHLPVRSVDVWMRVTPIARFWAPLLVPLFARLSRSVLKFPALWLAGNGSLSSAEARAEGIFRILVEARRGFETHCIVLQGKDVYGLTAEIAAYAAARMLAPGYDRAGVLAPAQALDPDDFLQWAQNNWKVMVQVDD